MIFDDDLFDAEILVERADLAEFSTSGLAALLGITNDGVYKLVRRGVIPRPSIAAVMGYEEQRWSKAQAVEILAARLRKAAAA